MKKKLFVSAVLGFLCSLLLISCQNNRNDSDTMEDGTQTPGITADTSSINAADDFWDTEKDYTYNEREEFQAEFRNAREKLDQKINEMQQRADNATGEMKETLNDQVDKLKDKRDDLDSKWRDFSNTTEENWDEFVSDINSVWNDVQTTWKDAESDLRENM